MKVDPNHDATTETTPAPQEPLAPIVLRGITYAVALATIVVGIQNDLYRSALYWLVPVFPLYLALTHFASEQIPKRFQSLQASSFTAQITVIVLMLDCLSYGVLTALFKFSLIPTITLILLASSTVVYLLGIRHWMFSMILLGIGTLLGVTFVDREIHFDTPYLVTLVDATGLLIYTTVTHYFAYSERCQLYATQKSFEALQRQSSALSRKLAKYLPPQVWGTIFMGRSDSKLETQRKKLSVFFSDIKGFSEIAEELQPESLTELLNSYFTEMSRIALRYGGTIDKFVGDAIMIFFGDPTSQGSKKDAIAAVSMAIEMRKHMKVMRQRWRKNGITRPIQIRIGVNTGYCTIGNFGAESRMDYTIVGKEVNLASRLESVAQPGEIYISHDTYELVRDTIMCRDKGSLNVKGFTKPVPIYEVIDFRKELGSTQSFIEHERDGFSMYLDMEKIRNYEKEKIIEALEAAAEKVKNRLIV